MDQPEDPVTELAGRVMTTNKEKSEFDLLAIFGTTVGAMHRAGFTDDELKHHLDDALAGAKSAPDVASFFKTVFRS